jgi:hypothetical protein
MLLVTLAVILAAPGGATQSLQPVEDNGPDQELYYSDRPGIDRYMDVEVWTNHADGEYYVGDDISVYFRASRDAFVSIYSVDSRGRVNLLFPSTAGEDNFVLGGETYRIPGDNWEYDLEVSGPAGIENIQIIASRERFPIPNWYRNSGLVCDWDDRNEFMDFLNGKHFVRYDGQRFAFDRAVIFVNEWEPDYYRPIYQPYYPSWSVVGNAYIDYGWGYSVYVNGIYWGCTPLYLPRIAVGWHTVTIYDPHGYCWESDIHFSRYNTVILNRTVVNPSASVKSKYKEVRTAGYRDPVSAGYSNFKTKSTSGAIVGSNGSYTNSKSTVISKNGSGDKSAGNYKYSRGSSTLVKTTRGFETDHSISSTKESAKASRTTNGPAGYDRYKSKKSEGSAYNSNGKASGSSSEYHQKQSGSSATRSSGSSNGNYQGKSGASSGKATVKSSGGASKSTSGSSSGTVKKSSSGKASSGAYKKSSGASSGSSGAVKSSGGSSKSSSGGTSKNSGGASKNSGGGKSSNSSSSSSKAKGKG